ncbi:hypothetical protein ACFVT2_19670 [Streptomyces sp. NPDC058000]|uniref:hypothetical protein n=1 Tax=Streptomyces sp. NPDC058000 TaxID=3346299 RepID=UPI0036F14AE1
MHSENGPEAAQGKRLVPFHYVLTGQSHRGEIGTVGGVVEIDVNHQDASRGAGFTYARELLCKEMGGVSAILFFSFERNAL